MARKRKRVTEARIRALNGGDEAYERHERVQRQLAEMADHYRRKAEEQRRLSEAQQGSRP
jgi:hypothetical protein